MGPDCLGTQVGCKSWWVLPSKQHGLEQLSSTINITKAIYRLNLDWFLKFLRLFKYSEVNQGCFIQRYESWKCDLRQLHQYHCRECLLKVFELGEASLFYLRLRKLALSNDQEKMKSYHKILLKNSKYVSECRFGTILWLHMFKVSQDL